MWYNVSRKNCEPLQRFYFYNPSFHFQLFLLDFAVGLTAKTTELCFSAVHRPVA